MAKRFKLKFSRVIKSCNSCRSKDPSNLPSNPVASIRPFSPANLHLPPLLSSPPQQQPSKHLQYFSIKRHMALAFASISSRFRSRATVQYLSETDHSKSPPPPEFHWKKEEKWHVVAKKYDETPRRKIYDSLVSAGLNYGKILIPSPPPAPPNTEKKRKQSKRMKKSTPRISIINSSSAESGLSSKDGLDDEQNHMDGEETETLLSSTRSFFTEYSSPDYLETLRENPFNRTPNYNSCRKKKVKKEQRYVKRKAKKICSESSSTSPSPARLSRFQWLIPCSVEGKVKESFAVVKKSEDPYEDFKKSMMEMIMEKQIFEVNDLEQMLQCFLSLNSRHHHGVIIQAFSEIWEALFCTRSITNGVNF